MKTFLRTWPTFETRLLKSELSNARTSSAIMNNTLVLHRVELAHLFQLVEEVLVVGAGHLCLNVQLQVVELLQGLRQEFLLLNVLLLS